jgi:fructokinase
MRIGIDLGGTKIEAVALDESGHSLVRQRVVTPSGDYDGTIEAIGLLVEGIEAELGIEGTVGVGGPGAISPASGTVKNANSVWLNGRPLHKDLTERLRRPVRLANDADCFALSEATDGAAAGENVVFGVILGTGVGGGIVVNGQLISGPNAISGEWGHNPLPWPRRDEWPGPGCYCGKTGCIETYLSGPGLAHDYFEATREPIGAQEVAERAASGDRRAEAALARYEDRLARALASLVNVLDPDVIVLGGGLANVKRLYVNVPWLWGRYVFSDRVDTRLVEARHGDSSGVRGAAWLWPA